MKEMGILLAIIIILTVFISYGNSVYDEKCRAHGGVPAHSKYSDICYTADAAIDLGV
jgi:hypothetical protein